MASATCTVRIPVSTPAAACDGGCALRLKRGCSSCSLCASSISTCADPTALTREPSIILVLLTANHSRLDAHAPMKACCTPTWMARLPLASRNKALQLQRAWMAAITAQDARQQRQARRPVAQLQQHLRGQGTSAQILRAA